MPYPFESWDNYLHEYISGLWVSGVWISNLCPEATRYGAENSGSPHPHFLINLFCISSLLFTSSSSISSFCLWVGKRPNSHFFWVKHAGENYMSQNIALKYIGLDPWMMWFDGGIITKCSFERQGRRRGPQQNHNTASRKIFFCRALNRLRFSVLVPKALWEDVQKILLLMTNQATYKWNKAWFCRDIGGGSTGIGAGLRE